MFHLARTRTPACANMLDDIAAERAAAASKLHDVEQILRDILNEQRVPRQTFDDAARSFIQHERRQIEIEERQLFPTALSSLTPADWAELRTELRRNSAARRVRQLKAKLQDQHRWIVGDALAEQAERSSLARSSK